MNEKKKLPTKEEAEAVADAMFDRVSEQFRKGSEAEKAKLAKSPKKYAKDEGMREVPLEHREKHLKD